MVDGHTPVPLVPIETNQDTEVTSTDNKDNPPGETVGENGESKPAEKEQEAEKEDDEKKKEEEDEDKKKRHRSRSRSRDRRRRSRSGNRRRDSERDRKHRRSRYQNLQTINILLVILKMTHWLFEIFTVV